MTTGSLLLGLGAHIVYNKFSSSHIPGIEDHVLSGLWQGVVLYHVFMISPITTLFGIGARLDTYDAARGACTLFGIAVGVFFAYILQVSEGGDQEDAYYGGSTFSYYGDPTFSYYGGSTYSYYRREQQLQRHLEWINDIRDLRDDIRYQRDLQRG